MYSVYLLMNVSSGNVTSFLLFFLSLDVNVMFVEGSYSYSEGDGSSSDIRVTTNRPFAQGITVGVSGGNEASFTFYKF